MYNNPFMYQPTSSFSKVGILRGLKSINWSTFLGNFQKSLGVINQAIPIVYQVKPIIRNAKTIFKIANSLKESPGNSHSTNEKSITKNNAYTNFDNESKPVFFL